MQYINGVNLGNWLVLEKWMSPSIFNDAGGAIDEYHLARCLERQEYIKRIKKHRDTFITEDDFCHIKRIGFNSVRIPVPFYIFGDRDPYIGCIEYLDRAFVWAKKYDRKDVALDKQKLYDNGVAYVIEGDGVYYDVTNFFFEKDLPDDDIVDDDGNVIEKSLGQMGVSKENRKQPIVQMGLFMDDQGIPISIESFPGNTLDCNTFKPAISKSIDGLDFARFIMIADRGMCNYQNILYPLNQNHGYIMAKGLRKSSREEQEWAISEECFTQVNDDFKYKSRIKKRIIKDENEQKRTITEKVIVYWTRKFYERDLHENADYIEVVEKILENPNGFRITAMQARQMSRFFNGDILNSETVGASEKKSVKSQQTVIK